MNTLERTKMVNCMEFICRQINDEDVFYGWLLNGVADGDIKYGSLKAEVDEYYLEDDNFADLMACFLRRMSAAKKSGGLYCDGIVSK